MGTPTPTATALTAEQRPNRAPSRSSNW
jgi:hypothetical protein